ncbi:cation:proton antiporter [Candidatus Saccharibacteria bacterium]|nr:cation:proton antiporter [Candidatus Saccharibacteria bacterium]
MGFIKKIINTVSRYKYASFALLVMTPGLVIASESAESSGHGDLAKGFLLLALILLVAKIGQIVEKVGQASVIGELATGIALSALGYFGLGIVGDIRGSEVIAFVAELGAVILLFQIGLESNIAEMKKVGLTAFIVAIVGVVTPFVLGTWVLAPIFFGDQSLTAHLFLGASMVATSVGITASVFKAIGISKSQEAQTVLGAAVIDDILGLIVLSIVSALASGGEVTPGLIAELSIKAFGFLGGSILIGSFLAQPISTLFSKIHDGVGMKLSLAISIALIFAYLASLVGLAPIVGAFAAGLLLDPVHFRGFQIPHIARKLKSVKTLDDQDKEHLEQLVHEQEHGHVEDLIGNLGLVFVPVFFAYTGLQIDFGSLLDPGIYLIAFVISIFAIISKMVAGLVIKKGNTSKLLVGFSMVPRGEVGLIFAATGKALGAINDEVFSIIVIMVIVTTFIAPFGIKYFATKLKQENN